MKKILPWFLAVACAANAFAATDPAQPRPELAERVAAARALYDARKLPEARQAFEKIAAADPKSADAQYFLAQLALRNSDAEKAVAYAEKAVELAPANADYHHALGDAYGNSAQQASVFSKFGLAKKCLAAYQRAVELAPAGVEFHLSLFDYYRQAPGLAGGGSDKAEAEAATILKLDPVRGHVAYATLYVAAKQFDQALPHLAEVKKLDASRGHLAYASLYTETKQYDKAFAEFAEVLKVTPDDYGALYQVGKLSAVTGQSLDRGLAALRRSLELTPGEDQPSHPAAQWRIGMILEKKNNPAAARAAYEAALKLDPKFPQAVDALKKLK